MTQADEANGRCGVAADIAALASDKAIDYIDGPVKIVTAPHVPVPFSPILEKAYLPSTEDVIEAVMKSFGKQY